MLPIDSAYIAGMCAALLLTLGSGVFALWPVLQGHAESYKIGLWSVLVNGAYGVLFFTSFQDIGIKQRRDGEEFNWARWAALGFAGLVSAYIAGAISWARLTKGHAAAAASLVFYSYAAFCGLSAGPVRWLWFSFSIAACIYSCYLTLTGTQSDESRKGMRRLAMWLYLIGNCLAQVALAVVLLFSRESLHVIKTSSGRDWAYTVIVFVLQLLSVAPFIAYVPAPGAKRSSKSE